MGRLESSKSLYLLVKDICWSFFAMLLAHWKCVCLEESLADCEDVAIWCCLSSFCNSFFSEPLLLPRLITFKSSLDAASAWGKNMEKPTPANWWMNVNWEDHTFTFPCNFSRNLDVNEDCGWDLGAVEFSLESFTVPDGARMISKSRCNQIVIHSP